MIALPFGFRRALRTRHRLAFLLAFALLLPGVGVATAAPSDNRAKLWDTCRKDDGEAGLSACMAIINMRGVPARERATAYYNRCYNFMMRHDYRSALAACDRSLEDNPSSFDSWLLRTVRLVRGAVRRSSQSSPHRITDGNFGPI